MSATPPYSRHFDLASASGRDMEISLSPGAAERAAIADWLGALSVESFNAVVRVARTGDDRFSYDAEFTAGVTQACVVTLAPVSSTLKGAFHRSFVLAPRRPGARRGVLEEPRSRKIEVLTMDDDEPELVAGSDIDLAAPILEELALALDPYPRAPGAELPATQVPPPPDEGPFAVLSKLKEPAQAAAGKGGQMPPKRRPKP